MVSVSTNQQMNNLLVPTDQSPEDSVGVVAFHPDRSINVFALGSWDSTVRMLEILEDNFKKPAYSGIGVIPLSNTPNANVPTKQLLCQKMNAPILDLRWPFPDTLLVLTGDGLVTKILVPSMTMTKLVTCPNSIFATLIVASGNLLVVTVSMDHYIRYWNPKEPAKPIKESKLLHAPICADSNADWLLVGCTQNQLVYLKFSEPDNIHVVHPGLEMVPSAVHLSPSSHDFLIGSIDGRVLVAEFLFTVDKAIQVNRRIAFKAHKEENDRLAKKLFQINSISFPDFKTCKTNIVHSSASEGILKVWDLTKKETTQEIKYSSMYGQITASGVSPNLKYGVVCCGYDWSQGVWGITRTTSKTGDSNAVLVVVTPLAIEIPRFG